MRLCYSKKFHLLKHLVHFIVDEQDFVVFVTKYSILTHTTKNEIIAIKLSSSQETLSVIICKLSERKMKYISFLFVICAILKLGYAKVICQVVKNPQSAVSVDVFVAGILQIAGAFFPDMHTTLDNDLFDSYKNTIIDYSAALAMKGVKDAQDLHNQLLGLISIKEGFSVSLAPRVTQQQHKFQNFFIVDVGSSVRSIFVDNSNHLSESCLKAQADLLVPALPIALDNINTTMANITSQFVVYFDALANHIQTDADNFSTEIENLCNTDENCAVQIVSKF